MAAIRCLFTLYAFEDGNKALSWAKKGAKLGDANFQYIVGLGLVSRDKQTEQIKGISELKKAANKNYFLAQVELARCYQEGKGVRKNLKLAEQWYRRAAFLGHKAAIFDVVQLMTTRAKDMSVLSEAYGWTLLLLRRTSAKGGQSLNENVLKPQREILEKAKKFRIAEKELILCSEKWVKDQNVRIPMTDPIDVKESPCKYLE